MGNKRNEDSLLQKLLSVISRQPGRVAKTITSKFFVFLTFGWFAAQAIFMAITTSRGLPPDEHYHFQFIQFFGSSGWLPLQHDQTGYFALGEAIRTPYFLYHYLLSVPVHIFGSGNTVFLCLRLLNVLFGLGSLFLLYKIADRLRVSKLVRNLSLFMLANTLMFVFLSASINYDNLFVLISLATVLLLVDLLKKPIPVRARLLVICLLAGLLIKVSFLPIAFIVLTILIGTIISNKGDLRKSLFFRTGTLTAKSGLIWLIFFLLFGLFLQRYAVNLALYKTTSPKCTQVHTIQECRQNPVFARDERLDNMSRPRASKDIVKYTGKWFLLMEDRIYGVFAHKSFTPYKFISGGITLLMLAGIIAFIRCYRFRDDRFMNLILIISAFYTGILIADNFLRYQKYGSFTFAVQGRYLFAVLPLMYVVVNKYTLDYLRKENLRTLYIAAVILFFTASSLPSYLRLTDSMWRNTYRLTTAQSAKNQNPVNTVK